MIFLFERYYEKQHDFPLKKAILESAKIVSRWASAFDIGYPFSYHSPKDEGTHIAGQLPRDIHEREIIIENSLNKLIIDYSKPDFCEGCLVIKLFGLTKLANRLPKPIFDYDNDISDWILDLNKQQFKELQGELVERGLPRDMFFSNNDWIIVPEESTQETKSSCTISSSKVYSPRLWKQINRKGCS